MEIPPGATLPLAKTLPILVQSTLYLLTAAALTVHLLPFLHTRFLPYGKARPSQLRTTTKPLLKPFDHLANLTVPKSWFLHYYALSLTLTLWWGLQLLNKSPLLVLILETETPGWLRYGGYLDQMVEKAGKQAGERSLDGVWIVLLCEIVQAGRRLYECMSIEMEGRKVKEVRDKATDGKGNGEIVVKKEGKSGESRMHLGIYLFGMLFYVLLSMAVWVDSANTILRIPKPKLPEFSFEAAHLPMMPMRMLIGIPTFLMLSGMQYDLHLYLASLEKYSLAPPFGYFGYILCPHYLAEIGIYLSLAILRGGLSGSMAAVLAFVATNLTLQGRECKLWYEKTFGKDRVGGRGGVWPWY